MTLIFWSVFVATVLLALLACPRKAAPALIVVLLAGLIVAGAGND